MSQETNQEIPGNEQRDNEGQVVIVPNQPPPGEVPPEPQLVPIRPAEEDAPLEAWPEEDKPPWQPDPGE